jgi:hypothetical protein
MSEFIDSVMDFSAPKEQQIQIPLRRAVKKKRIQKAKSQIDPQRDASAEFNLENQKTFLEKGGKYTPGEIAEMERYAALKAKESGIKTLKGGEVAEGVGEAKIRAARDPKVGKSSALSGGSKGAGLTNMGLQMAGMKTDSAAGGGISGGLQAAAMTGNPYIIAGAAVLGAIQGEAQRKAKNKQLEAQAELAKAQAQSTASAQKQKAMAQMGQAFQGYFS